MAAEDREPSFVHRYFRWRQRIAQHPWLFAIGVTIAVEIMYRIVANIGYTIFGADEQTKDNVDVGAILLILMLAFGFVGFLEWQYRRANRSKSPTRNSY